MKHLRRFNESFLSETISDICLDLEDEGYYTSVSPESETRKHIQTVRITKCNDDYIPDLSLGFRPIDIQDTLDRIYTVLGKNLIGTSIRLYNNRIDYYDVRMLDEIGHQSIKTPGTLKPNGLYPNVKIYGIEIRFFQPGDYGTHISYGHGYDHNESNLIVYQSKEENDEILEYIDTILLDIEDFGLIHEVISNNKHGENYRGMRSDRNIPLSKIFIYISGHDAGSTSFEYSDISNSINHITSYLSEYGFNVDPSSTSYKHKTLTSFTISYLKK